MQFSIWSHVTVFILAISIYLPQLCFSQTEEFGGETPPEMSQCEAPDVLLLLDRSGSMLDDDKWGQATRAISDVFVTYFDTLRFGMITFPTTGSCGVEEGDLAIPIGETQMVTLDEIYNTAQPTDEALTPLSEAIRLGHQALEAVQEPQRRGYLILLTDGIETCAPEALEDSAPIASAQQAANAGFKTYVIGFGSLVRRSTLREIARVGGTDQEKLVSDQTQLSETLTAIIESATTEICDRLDNDCDGQVDEGLNCEISCNPEFNDCPCNNDLDCTFGETCVGGLCKPAPCDRLCDAGYICYQDRCILEGSDPTSQPAEMSGGMIILDPTPMQSTPMVPGSSTPNNETTMESGSSCIQGHQKLNKLLIILSLLGFSIVLRHHRKRIIS